MIDRQHREEFLALEEQTHHEAAQPARQRAGGIRPAPTKRAQTSKLLGRAKGATIAELAAATGWQPHSVRALLSSLRKAGVRLVREARKTGEGCYRIEAESIATDPQETSACAAIFADTIGGA